MPITIGNRRSPPGDIVDALLECHQRIRSFVGLAITVAGRADLAPAEVVDACQRIERYFVEALPLHVQDEEEGLLPRLRGLRPQLDEALAAMAAQHATHRSGIAALLAAAAGLRERPLDGARRTELAEAAAELEREFATHLELEEQQIFPALRALLPEATRKELLDELRQRRRG